MTATDKTTIKSYFETGDKPTAAQFVDFIDSYFDANAVSTFGGTIVSANAAVSARTLLNLTYATTAQAITGTTPNLVMDPVCVRNAIASALPAPVSPGALILITAATAANSATVDFTSGINSTYDEYILEMVNVVPSTNSVQPNLRVSTDGGSTFDSGSNYDIETTFVVNTNGGNGGNEALDRIYLYTATSSQLGNATLKSFSCQVRIYNPADTSRAKTFLGQSVCYDNSQHTGVNFFGGSYKVSAAVNGLRVYMGSGNISSGNFYLYGVKKS